MGLHSSPTGELFLDDVRVGQRPAARRDRGRARRGGREGAKATFTMERSGVAAMALGIIEQCLELSRRVREGRACSSASPIGEFQLIQLKLAKMEVARLNVAEPRVPHARDGRRRASR